MGLLSDASFLKVEDSSVLNAALPVKSRMAWRGREKREEEKERRRKRREGGREGERERRRNEVPEYLLCFVLHV